MNVRDAIAAAAFALCAQVAAAEAQIKPWNGPSTPPLAQPDLAGQTVDLKDLRGKVVVVNFWATWCEPCRDEMPSLERLRSMMSGKPFEVLAVNYGEGTQKVSDFVKRQNLSMPVLLDADKQAASAWKAGGLPITYVVDAKGRVRYWVYGERDWSQGEPLRLVENLLAEGPSARR